MSDLHKLARESAVTDRVDCGKRSTILKLGKKFRTLATRKSIWSLGIGGCVGGALALAYRLVFESTSTLDGVELVIALVGAASYHLFVIVVGRPLSYYRSLLELYLVRQLIGEQTRAEITRELTFRYFLGDSDPRARQVSQISGRNPETLPSNHQTAQQAGGTNGAARGDGSAAY